MHTAVNKPVSNVATLEYDPNPASFLARTAKIYLVLDCKLLIVVEVLVVVAVNLQVE